jgi:hypothetical protein
MNNVKDDKIIVIVARRNSGKSFLVRDIMFHHQDIPLGMVISPTEHANRFYGEFVPDVFIHDEYHPDLIANMIKRQRLVMAKRNQGASIDPRAFLIMDDCMFDNTWVTDRNIRATFFNGRHYKLFYILTMQFVLGIPPVLRSQIDYVFLLREPSIANQRRIYDNFGGVFPSFDIFSQVLTQTTNNFEALCIDNTCRSNRLEEQVFWYKARERPSFRLGSIEYWRMNAEEYEDAEDYLGGSEISSMVSTVKSKLPMVTVRKKI